MGPIPWTKQGGLLTVGIHPTGKESLSPGSPMKQCKEMAAKQHYGHRERRSQQESQEPLHILVDTDIGQPTAHQGKWQDNNLKKIQAGASPDTARDREKLQETTR